jgi:hypothetical protein
VGAIEYCCQTHWESYQDEVEWGNTNQFDLDVAIKRMKAAGQVDETLSSENEPFDIVSSEQWELLQQYEGAMEPIHQYGKFTQHAMVITHEKLFVAHRAIEGLKAPFFYDV